MEFEQAAPLDIGPPFVQMYDPKLPCIAVLVWM